MALAGVLSAMREIILDAPQLPPTRDERLIHFRSRFPALSEAEREDLSKIDPALFDVYTKSIFRGERNLLRNQFPVTMAVLAARWESVYGSRFDAFDLTVRLHRAYPWKSASTVQFAENFRRFIGETLPEFIARYPMTSELVELEELTIRARRVTCAKPLREVALSDLTSLTVAEILALQLQPSTATTLYRSSFDVISLVHQFYQLGKSLPEQLPEKSGHYYGVCGQDSEGVVIWEKISATQYDCLYALKSDNPHSFDAFAEATLADLPDSLTEEAAFGQVLHEAVRVQRVGGFSFCQPN